MKTRRYAQRDGYAILTILAVGVAVRIMLYAAFSPWYCGDTATLLNLANCIQRHDLSQHFGARAPGYSLFAYAASLGLADVRGIVLAQMLCGLSTSILLYALVREITGNRAVAWAAGLLDAVCINRILFEIMLLSESLATVLIMASVWWFVRIVRRGGANAWPWAVLGLLIAAAGLTRPNNLYLFPVFLAAAWLYRETRRDIETWLKNSAMFLIACTVPVLAWCIFMQATLGVFGIVSITGFHLTHKTLDFVELAPDRFAAMRDVLIRWETKNVSANVPLDSRIWLAMPQLEALPIWQAPQGPQRTVEISRALMRMDRWLMGHHPVLYADEVGRALWRFWVTPTADPAAPPSDDVVKDRTLQAALQQIKSIEAPAVDLLYITFFALTTVALAGTWSRRCAIGFFGWFLVLCVLIADLSCAWIEYGNGRLLLPYQPIIEAAVAVMAYQIFAGNRRHIGAREETHG